MREIRGRVRSICLALAVVLLSSADAGATTHTITVTSTTDFGNGTPLNIAFGDTVIWVTRHAFVSHNATACVGLGANPTRDQIAKCETFGGRFATSTEPGPTNGSSLELGRTTFNQLADSGASYFYLCTIHANFMQGEIVVAPPPTPEIALSTSAISPSVSQGSNVPATSFTVRNSDTGTLSYSITDTNTNAIDWVSVNPTSGSSVGETDTIAINFNTSGLPVGSFTGTITVSDSGATNSPQTISVSLTVIAQPTIALSKSAISPSTMPGSNASADSFTVTNSGGGTLSYSVTDANNNAIDWISVNPTSGSSAGEADTIDITFNTAGLAAGDYTGTITVTADATNSPQTIDVALSVTAQSSIALSKSMLTPSVTVGSNATADSFSVSNSGGGTLGYSITDTNQTAIDWISVSPSNGSSTGEADSISVTFNTSALPVGDYDGTITVVAAGASNSPQTIAVSLSVVSSPSILLSKSMISPMVNEGSNATSDSFTVANSGGGTLTYSITDTNDDPIDWITLSRTQGTSTGEADGITVNFDTAGLSAQVFSGTITVSAAGATNSPQVISVELTVVAQPPMLTVSKSTISRTVALGSNATPDSFAVSNSGGGALSYSITDTNDTETDWITVDPTGGSSSGESDTIAVTFNTAGLPADNYSGVITITASGASNSPQTIAVSLSVTATPPTISLSRVMISRIVARGMDADSSSFTVTNSGGETLLYSITDTNDDPIDWISLSPTGGSSTGESDTIAIVFATSGLANGQFEGTITVSAPGATNTPRSISIVLSVGGNPALESRWDVFSWDADDWGPIPEPSSMLLNLSALVALAGLYRLRALGRCNDRERTARCRVRHTRA